MRSEKNSFDNIIPVGEAIFFTGAYKLKNSYILFYLLFFYIINHYFVFYLRII